MEEGEVVSETKVPADAKLPTTHGDFRIRVFHEEKTGFDHVALTLGNMDGPDPVLMRVHSECLTGDAFGSIRCDCGPQFQMALSEISSAGKGVLLYIRQEGRGIGLANKLRAYKLQDEGLDTIEANEKLGYPADMRDYGIGAQILHDLGVRRMKLLTNNPKKLTGLAGYGLEVTAQIPISPDVQKHNAEYLKTKRDKMGHSLEL